MALPKVGDPIPGTDLFYDEADIANLQSAVAQETRDVGIIGPNQGIDLKAKADKTLEGLEGKPTEPTPEPAPKLTPEQEHAEFIKGLEEFNKKYGRPLRDATGIKKLPGGLLDTSGAFDETGNVIGGTKTPTAPAGDIEEDPRIIQMQSDIASLEAEAKELREGLSKFAITDETLKAQTDAIATQYNALITEMRNANERRVQAMKTLGMRLGSRFTGGIEGGVFGGAVQEEVRQGILRVGELEAKKQAAIAEAKESARKQNWEVYSLAVDRAEKAVEDKRKELDTLNENLIDRAKELREAEKDRRQIEKDALDNSQKIITSLGYVALNSLTGDAEADIEVIKSIAQQYGIDPNKLLSEVQRLETEKIKYPVGEAGEFRFAQQNFADINPDLPFEEWPVHLRDYDKWRDREADIKLRIAVASRAEKPPTQAQSLAAGYAARLEQAEPVISSLEDEISKMSAVSFEAQIFTDRPVFQSTTIQSYMQAARNFINAQLRRESGAVISPSEFSEARKQYLPQPGDTKGVLKQKQENRKISFEVLKSSAGPAFESYMELLGTPPEKPKQLQIGGKIYELQSNGKYKLKE